MRKEIKIKFTGQSKALVEETSITYSGEVEEFEASEKYLKENILKENIELQVEAGRHARNETFKKQR